MTSVSKYDQIGCGYNRFRQAEPQLVRRLVELLSVEKNGRIVDVGAGSGNYSNAIAKLGYRVCAIEPSHVMREQAERHPDVEWFDAVAEQIPLDDDAVGGAVAILSSHHFSSLDRAIAEMIRVATHTIVILTYDPRVAEPFWLSEYFPRIFEEDCTQFLPVDQVAQKFEQSACVTSVVRFPIPHDIEDLFLAGPWRRPELYLDPDVRSGMSVFAMADADRVAKNVSRLREDLQSGTWQRRHGSIKSRLEFDAGYRFIVARLKSN